MRTKEIVKFICEETHDTELSLPKEKKEFCLETAFLLKNTESTLPRVSIMMAFPEDFRPASPHNCVP